MVYEFASSISNDLNLHRRTTRAGSGRTSPGAERTGAAVRPGRSRAGDVCLFVAVVVCADRRVWLSPKLSIKVETKCFCEEIRDLKHFEAS